MAQQSAFATGVLPDIYAFHRYTGNSLCPYHTLAFQFPSHDNPSACALRPVIPINARTLCITAAAGTELAGASSLGNVKVATC